jgi:nucleoid-associated protein YgaU
MRRLLIAALVLAVSVTGMVWAQNLLDNDAYRKALQLRDQAQQALNSGQYSQAQQLSQQSQDYAKKAVDIAQQMQLGYRATNWLQRAKDRVSYATSIKASERYPSEWKTAQEQYSTAQSTYNSKDFLKSIDASQAVLAALKNIKPAVVAATPPPAPAANVQPEYYTVRLIPSKRDCFWNIAAYPFVYGNPLKWRILYDANKNILQDPNNPDLIQPGQVFKIPSINGEKRQGMYKPGATGAQQ